MGAVRARSVYHAVDAGLLGVSRGQLTYKPTGKRGKKSGTRMAYTNARGRPITERPQEAGDRSEYGHWEMDTVAGGTGTSPACLLVMTERMTRRQIIRKLPARTQGAVARELNRLERSRRGFFNGLKTITCDNGCEFLDFAAIEKSARHAGRRCEVFYADWLLGLDSKDAVPAPVALPDQDTKSRAPGSAYCPVCGQKDVTIARQAESIVNLTRSLATLAKLRV